MNKRTAYEIVKGLNTQVDNRSMPVNAAYLRTRRAFLGLTQQQVADTAGIMREAYARVESGGRPDPQLSTAEAIARALRCKVDDLIVKRRR